MRGEILELLKKTDGYISGQELCERFGVSRTAIWKIMNQFKEEGYPIEAVRNKGYILHGECDVLTKEELKSSIRTEWAGQTLACYEKTDSTNIRARLLADRGAPHGTLVVAERQTVGKGRRGRSWASPAGEGIWMSLILRPQITSVSAPMLTLVMALSVEQGLREAAGTGAMIKWPNDLVINGRKICGILTEMSTELMEIQHVVIGVGINVNIESFPGELEGLATSLFIESGSRFQRSRIVAGILSAFETYYERFCRTEDMSDLFEDYNRRLVNLGREVCVIEPGKEFRGVCRGIDQKGSLLVETEDGRTQEIISGEVSVRGVYGYV